MILIILQRFGLHPTIKKQPHGSYSMRLCLYIYLLFFNHLLPTACGAMFQSETGLYKNIHRAAKLTLPDSSTLLFYHATESRGFGMKWRNQSWDGWRSHIKCIRTKKNNRGLLHPTAVIIHKTFTHCHPAQQGFLFIPCNCTCSASMGKETQSGSTLRRTWGGGIISRSQSFYTLFLSSVSHPRQQV